jgi:hypothetical protein
VVEAEAAVAAIAEIVVAGAAAAVVVDGATVTSETSPRTI